MTVCFGAGAHGLEAGGFGIQVSDQRFDQVDFEDTVLDGLEADIPTNQSPGDRVGVIQEADLSAAPHPPGH
jgi:hypothetical protein